MTSGNTLVIFMFTLIIQYIKVAGDGRTLTQ